MLSVQEETEISWCHLQHQQASQESHGGKKLRLSRKREETKYTDTSRHFSSIPLDGNKMLYPWFQKISTHFLGILSGRCQGFCSSILLSI